MKHFLNRNVLLHAAITFTSTAAFLALIACMGERQSLLPLTGMILYICIIAASTTLLSKRDEHQGYFGFNYHLVTYIIVVGFQAVLYAVHVSDALPGMALCWGIGLLIHLLVLLILFRKRRIKSYDKKELFN